jgi:hypothetical protein
MTKSEKIPCDTCYPLASQDDDYPVGVTSAKFSVVRGTTEVHVCAPHLAPLLNHLLAVDQTALLQITKLR